MHSLPWGRRRDEAQSWMSTLEGFTNMDGHGATGTAEYTHHVPTSDGVNSRDVSPTILRLVNASREMLALLQRLAGKDAVAIAALEQANTLLHVANTFLRIAALLLHVSLHLHSMSRRRCFIQAVYARALLFSIAHKGVLSNNPVCVYLPMDVDEV